MNVPLPAVRTGGGTPSALRTRKEMIMPRPNQVVSVRHPEHGGYVTPSPAIELPEGDPLVMAYPWLFTESDADPGEMRESITIERATRAPGERRPGRVTGPVDEDGAHLPVEPKRARRGGRSAGRG